MKRRTVKVIRVFPSVLDRSRGRLVAGPLVLRCRLGRSGPTRRKREGDGATPIGRCRALGVVYRADRMGRPRTSLRVAVSGQEDGWCDDPAHARYNQPVRLPHPARHERMWRDDHLYDLVVDLSWNRRPAVPGRGSAIFLHCASAGRPTEGCIAVERAAIARLVSRIGPRTILDIRG